MLRGVGTRRRDAALSSAGELRGAGVQRSLCQCVSRRELSGRERERRYFWTGAMGAFSVLNPTWDPPQTAGPLNYHHINPFH